MKLSILSAVLISTVFLPTLVQAQQIELPVTTAEVREVEDDLKQKFLDLQDQNAESIEDRGTEAEGEVEGAIDDARQKMEGTGSHGQAIDGVKGQLEGEAALESVEDKLVAVGREEKKWWKFWE